MKQTDSSNDFRAKYKAILNNAENEFKRENQNFENINFKDFALQVMATIGLEIENKFPNLNFKNGNLKLFGRRKSKASLETKKVLFTQDFEQELKEALQNNAKPPKKIRSIYDYYAFKIISGSLSDPYSILATVTNDILQDIKKHSPKEYEQIQQKLNQHNKSNNIELGFNNTNLCKLRDTILLISENFSDKYPRLKELFFNVIKSKSNAEQIQNYINTEKESIKDISNLSYDEFFNKLKHYYYVLHTLAYSQSKEEIDNISKKMLTLERKQNYLKNQHKDKELIPEHLREDFSNQLAYALQELENKKSNKLDLSLISIIVLDVLSTSEKLKSLGVTCSKDPSRTKLKRSSKGYIANFFSLDLPQDLKIELQVQSKYRFDYGEIGPAAHNLMENNIKQRKFIQLPKKSSEYSKWENKQFKEVPQFFNYLGSGKVYVCGMIENFKKHYGYENPKTVESYINYITEHNCFSEEKLIAKNKIFSLESKSTFPQISAEESKENKEIPENER